MRSAELREGILAALEAGPASSSALQAMVEGASGLHDEIWGGGLRGLIKDGVIVKVLGNYRLTGQKVPTAPKPNAEKPMLARSKIDRSAAGLREALFDAIDGLRSGALDVKQANAIAGAAGTIIKSMDSQIAFERLRMEKKVPFALPSMSLVANDQGE